MVLMGVARVVRGCEGLRGVVRGGEGFVGCCRVL